MGEVEQQDSKLNLFETEVYRNLQEDTDGNIIVANELHIDSYDIAERIIRVEDRTSNLSAGDSGKFAQYYQVGQGFNNSTIDASDSYLKAVYKFNTGAGATDSVGSNTLTGGSAAAKPLSPTPSQPSSTRSCHEYRLHLAGLRALSPVGTGRERGPFGYRPAGPGTPRNGYCRMQDPNCRAAPP